MAPGISPKMGVCHAKQISSKISTTTSRSHTTNHPAPIIAKENKTAQPQSTPSKTRSTNTNTEKFTQNNTDKFALKEM